MSQSISMRRSAYMSILGFCFSSRCVYCESVSFIRCSVLFCERYLNFALTPFASQPLPSDVCSRARAHACARTCARMRLSLRADRPVRSTCARACALWGSSAPTHVRTCAQTRMKKAGMH
eukprot:5509157-Pleurochrysis_carterae.AAC.2